MRASTFAQNTSSPTTLYPIFSASWRRWLRRVRISSARQQEISARSADVTPRGIGPTASSIISTDRIAEALGNQAETRFDER
jgi:hypothetical protein